MKKAVVLVDLQNDFIDGSLGSKEAQAIIPNVIEKIEEYSKEYSIFFATKDTHSENYMETQEGKNLPVEHCIFCTEGWLFNKEIMRVLEKEYEWGIPIWNVTLEKSNFGTFSLPKAIKVHEVDEYGNEAKFDEIIVIGLCTDVCVISNVVILKTAFPETKISVVENCCAGITPEKHESAIEVMRSLQVNII